MISYSILPTGSSCTLLCARVDSDHFVIVPPPPKGSALVISHGLGNSWPHKDSSKGGPKPGSLSSADAPQSAFSSSAQSSLPTTAQQATHPLLFLGWRKLWKLIREKQDQAKAKSHATSFHKKKRKPSSLLSQQSRLSSAIADAGKASRT